MTIFFLPEIVNALSARSTRSQKTVWRSTNYSSLNLRMMLTIETNLGIIIDKLQKIYSNTLV